MGFLRRSPYGRTHDTLARNTHFHPKDSYRQSCQFHLKADNLYPSVFLSEIFVPLRKRKTYKIKKSKEQKTIKLILRRGWDSSEGVPMGEHTIHLHAHTVSAKSRQATFISQSFLRKYLHLSEKEKLIKSKSQKNKK